MVPVNRYLVDLIREDLGMMGTKRACDQGACGSCSIIMDGELISSCLVLAVRADGSSVETIEGLGGLEDLHPLQAAFASYGATQCGYCTPGMIVSAKKLLDENPDPSEAEIQHWLTGNLLPLHGIPPDHRGDSRRGRGPDRTRSPHHGSHGEGPTTTNPSPPA